MQDNSTSLHGVALNIYTSGIILTGTPGIGKSELGIELIARGHKFIADDLVCLNKIKHNLQISRMQEEAFIYLRGLGFINMAKIYGQASILNSSTLNLIIELTDNLNFPDDCLAQLREEQVICGCPIPYIKLIKGVNRPLASLIEIIVKYEQHKALGYDSHQLFIAQHLNLVQGKP